MRLLDRTLVFLTLASIVTVGSALTTESAFAQQREMRRIEITDPSQAGMIAELGALMLLQDSHLVVQHIAPPEKRSESYESVDLQVGDHVLMINGKRLVNADSFRAVYDTVAPGSAVKLGIKRGETMRLVAFARGTEADSPKGMMMFTNAQPGSEGVERQLTFDSNQHLEIVAGLGLLLTDGSGGAQVTQLLPAAVGEPAIDIKAGDLIVELSGKKIGSAASFIEVYSTLEVGQEVTWRLLRDGEELIGSFIKPVEPKVMIQTQTTQGRPE